MTEIKLKIGDIVYPFTVKNRKEKIEVDSIVVWWDSKRKCYYTTVYYYYFASKIVKFLRSSSNEEKGLVPSNAKYFGWGNIVSDGGHGKKVFIPELKDPEERFKFKLEPNQAIEITKAPLFLGLTQGKITTFE